MNIDVNKWSDRFVFGIVGLFVSAILLLMLGTDVGRGFLLFAIIVLAIILTLGWMIDVAKEAYEEYI